MTTATVGAGTLTLGSAVPRFRSFAAAGVSNGDTFRYVIEDGNAWETGTGSLSGVLLARTLIDSSTGTHLSLSGNAEIYIGLLAGDVFTPDERAKLSGIATDEKRHRHESDEPRKPQRGAGDFDRDRPAVRAQRKAGVPWLHARECREYGECQRLCRPR